MTFCEFGKHETAYTPSHIRVELPGGVHNGTACLVCLRRIQAENPGIEIAHLD